jgi:hypothetical protein
MQRVITVLLLIRRRFRWIIAAGIFSLCFRAYSRLISNGSDKILQLPPDVPLPSNVRNVIYDFAECQIAVEELLQEVRSSGTMVGLDCEWRSNKLKAKVNETPSLPVAVLQLSTETTCCVIAIHAVFGHHKAIPPALREFLADAKIVKVGLGIAGDAKRLAEAFKVVTNSCLDILAVRSKLSSSPEFSRSKFVLDLPERNSLDALTKHLFGIKLCKSQDIICSDWQAVPLLAHQIHYAAADAFYSLRVMLGLLRAMEADIKQRSAQASNSSPLPPIHPGSVEPPTSIPLWYQDLLHNSSLEEAECPGKRIRKHSSSRGAASGSGFAGAVQQDEKEKARQTDRQRGTTHTPPAPSPAAPHAAVAELKLMKVVDDAQSIDAESENRTISLARQKHLRQEVWKQKYTRKKPLYDNCRLLAPDGVMLTTCDRAKIEWYLSQRLGELVSSDPPTLRLNFEPAGRAQNEYYMSDKANRCVVCGSENNLVRHFVVPRCYRYKFPAEFKSHSSHDILPVCFQCHALAMRYERKLQKRIAMESHAPLAGNASDDAGGSAGSDGPASINGAKRAAAALLAELRGKVSERAHNTPSSGHIPGNPAMICIGQAAGCAPRGTR